MSSILCAKAPELEAPLAVDSWQILLRFHLGLHLPLPLRSLTSTALLAYQSSTSKPESDITQLHFSFFLTNLSSSLELFTVAAMMSKHAASLLLALLLLASLTQAARPQPADSGDDQREVRCSWFCYVILLPFDTWNACE
ncbi:hypothetical protein GW17_00017884 [Ensete ventricosum]|nr:hypothetical protein GW17_00017884 [Ensete ventricosum]